MVLRISSSWKLWGSKEREGNEAKERGKLSSAYQNPFHIAQGKDLYMITSAIWSRKINMKV